LQRAQAHNDLAHWDQAAIDARQVLRSEPGNAKARVVWATSLMGRWEVDSAAMLVGPIVKRGPSVDADLLMARIHRHRQRPSEALVLLDRVQALTSDDLRTRVLRERGEALALMGDTARARVLLDSALARAPKDPIIHNSIGWYLYALHGQHQKAIEAYTRAVKYNLNYSFAFNNRGWSYHQLGQDDKAFKDIRNAMNRAPSNPYTYRNMGLVHLDRSEVDKACAQFKKALERGYTVRFGNDVQDLVDKHCKAAQIEGLQVEPSSTPEQEALPPIELDPVPPAPAPASPVAPPPSSPQR
jgi:tetratricopeptide (TPR) repeat protein